MDYCDAPDEVQKNPKAKEYFLHIANGDADVFRFLWAFWNFEHCYDDLIDRDKQVTQEQAVKCLVDFVTMISFNPFYQQYKHTLHPLIIQACTRWLDGDEWARSDDPEKRTMARVVRCGDVDIMMQVAYLTGGWEFMREVRYMRQYDSNDLKEK